MAQGLSQEFVERKISRLTTIPEDWHVDRSHYFKLDLKMCRLKSVMYSFMWDSDTDSSKPERFKTVVEMPSRIIAMDLSLNELSSLDWNMLSPLRNLRALDASLNRISRIALSPAKSGKTHQQAFAVGVEQLKHLQTLNLAHNAISRVDLLPSCPSLVDLNLSMNDLEDISGLPSMVSLTVLRINNNKLKSLDGLQSLGRLKQLYVHNNEVTDLIPLCSCLHLTTLNAANNRVTALKSATDVLGRLRKLRTLILEGNPVERSPSYQTELLHTTTIVSLDNVPIKSPLKQIINGEKPQLADNFMSIRELTRQVYEDHINSERMKMEENINFMQGRIISLQNNFEEFERNLRSDLDLCLIHLEGLSSSQLARFDPSSVRTQLHTPEPKPWQVGREDERDMSKQIESSPKIKTDYKGVKDTDEILRLAYLELSKDPITLE